MIRQSIKQILLLLLPLLMLSACKQEDKGIAGEDNFLLAFTLTDAESNIYPALIEGDRVRLQIPYDVDITRLSAKYQVSQLASIAPDPAKITDWSQVPTLTVTSKMGENRTYRVVIEQTPAVQNQSITLLTQEQVDQFVASEHMIINGDLILGAASGTDTIRDISALAKIEEIRYNLIIHSTFKADISALSGLKKVGGIVLLEANHLQALELPNLEVIAQDIRLTLDDSRVTMPECLLTTLSLPKLTRMGDLMLNKSGQLSHISLPSLQVAGTIKLESIPFDVFDFSSLQEARAITITPSPYLKNEEIEEKKMAIRFPSLVYCDHISLRDFRRFQGFYFDQLEKCQTFSLKSYTDIGELLLPKLVEAVSFNIDSYQDKMGKLSLPELVKVKDDLMLGLVKEVEIPKLAQAKKLRIRGYYPALFEQEIKVSKLILSLDDEEFSELSLNHFTIEEDLHLALPAMAERVEMPSELKGELVATFESSQMPLLEGLQKVGKRFSISGGVIEVILPESLVEVGRLETQSSWSAKSIESQGLKKVEFISFPSRVETISMPRLASIGEDLNLDRRSQLATIDLSGLTSIGGKLIISGSRWSPNNALRDLNGLSVLKEVKSIEINNCTELKDYSGLKTLIEAGGLTEKGWKVSDNGYNPTFQDLIDGKFIGE